MMIEHYASGNKAEFARILSISPQNLNSWLNNGYMDIEKVFRSCDGVSPEWLLTGDGEMLTVNRPLAVLRGDQQIRVLYDEDLLSGKWDDFECFILARNCAFLDFDYDFITRIPSEDLAHYISYQSPVGCKIVGVDELKEKCLYIVQSRLQGTFFVQYEGKDNYKGQTVLTFTTRRDGPENPDLLLALPPKDIIRCAEIVVFSVNYSAHYNL